ncbi:hypothetical protein [Vibrio hippocampi]|uniref:Superfamily II DNA and RNA helicase n=1 Tax=Vibrio hippocampi TaxID=654686 RepID=A0ABN8DF89_9VIBR|nr:hypothetical protein [Vibrio hippocampi]CAH0525819.1 hypothetical protein VHP8226_01350 [Vibrio hippocampi]
MHSQNIYTGYKQASNTVSATARQASLLNDDILCKVNQLISKKQWVLMTAECPRPTMAQVSRFHALGQNMVQMKPSHTLNQFQVVEKAIRSGNACAVIANGTFSTSEQARLHTLAIEFDCELIYLNSAHRLH